jgi:hypothetical protein
MEAPEGFAGSFAMVGLSEGRYSVGFSGGCVDANYATTYWRGGASVQVKPGTVVSGIELRLAAGGQITGTVTSSRGVGLSGVCVLVTSSNPTENLAVNFTLTFGGSYDAVGLPSGSYSVFFVPCGQDQNYLEMDYGSSVGVDIGKVTSGISAVLLNGAEIEGTVISASGTSLSDICVAAASASDVRK